MGAPDQKPRQEKRNQPRSVDDFDFDEEAFLAALDGSCRTPIGALARLKNDTLFMHGRLLAADGSDMVETHISCAPEAAEAAGRAAGEDLRRAAPHLVTG